ncbi:MAG: hypothetical protein JO291_11090 [Acidimicrobiia bacterium]|nr:hypothetical protein [Acidimicrobiia bacterium]
MAPAGRGLNEQRLGQRAVVHEPATLIVEEQRRFRGSVAREVPVTIRDVSVTGALVALPEDVRPMTGQTVVLVIDGHAGRTRVRRSDGAASNIVGLEFVDPHPAFLPIIHRWLGRSAALGDHDMR